MKKKMKAVLKKRMCIIMIVVVHIIVFSLLFHMMSKAYEDIRTQVNAEKISATASYISYRQKSEGEAFDWREAFSDYPYNPQEEIYMIAAVDAENKVTLLYSTRSSFIPEDGSLRSFFSMCGLSNAQYAQAVNGLSLTTPKAFKLEDVRFRMAYATDDDGLIYLYLYPESNVSGLANLVLEILIVWAIMLIASIGLVYYDTGRKYRSTVKELDDAKEVIKNKDTRYSLFSELVNEFMFEYDISSDTMMLSEKYHDIFHRGKTFLHFVDTLSSHYTIYHQDMEHFNEAFQSIKAGKRSGEFMFRLQMRSGEYEWFRAVYKVSVDEKTNQPITVVGKLYNIHQSKTEKDMLISKSTTDPLTKLLNREAAQKEIQTYIQENMVFSAKAALLIMDLDHFKSVNDTFGHAKGDELLREVGETLRATFRNDDIVCRLGGDEFLVFMKNISQESDALRKCEEVCEVMRKRVTQDGVTISVSSSVGIVFVNPEDEFLDIYMKADSALYNAKENGRNRFFVYSAAAHTGNTFDKKS